MSDLKTSFAQQAQLEVKTYIETHPGYTLDGVEQPGQGSTNHVIFAQRGDETVVFKVFCESERKQRACFALEHWKDTGLVPLLIADVSADMIIITHIPGTYLAESRVKDAADVWHKAVVATGNAVGTLTQVPLSQEAISKFTSQFYYPHGNLDPYLNRILDLGKLIHKRDKDFRDRFWQDNLRFIELQLPYILSQPCTLYHQDVSNLHVQQGCFMGFFDLEMCRIGCPAMQLGASLGMLNGDIEAWQCFRTGWELGTGQILSRQAMQAAVAAYYLLGWREISRYLSYDGTPGTGYSWALPADALKYANSFVAAAHMINVDSII